MNNLPLNRYLKREIEINSPIAVVTLADSKEIVIELNVDCIKESFCHNILYLLKSASLVQFLN
nr:hypothetical protein [Candidatus Riesia pediculischaeffi]